MNKFNLLLFFAVSVLLVSCDKDDDNTPAVDAPTTYEFTRAGASTVSFSGQTTRILMAEELVGAMKDFSSAEELMLDMYRNASAEGGDVNPFSDESLNASTKSIRSKVAASRDFFSTSTAISAEIRKDFEDWISAQFSEIFSNENTLAAPGLAGQIADGSSTRYINAQGLEYDQMVNKGLIGALMVDQMLNNYLGTAVLDEGTNVEDNDNELLSEDKNYTNMEHKWDEAYGYLYGTAADPTNPNQALGEADNFLNKYLGRVERDPDFEGMAETIFNAFKLGRAAIVSKEYDLRDEQAAIIREAISEIIGIRAVYYLIQGKIAFENGDEGAAFHDLSEGFGFIYSLQFTRNPDTNQPYFSKTEVDAFLADLLADGPNGLWDVNPTTLENMASTIAAPFDFTVEQAGE